MGLKNGLIFGGINSLDYGIYISGDAVFNAPTRNVDLIQIPGRNGDFALDHGRFENIEVSYPAGTFGDDQKDFREKLSDFRNAILSQVGYQRLTDSYHPDEYRLGVYMSGLDVDPAHYNTAGEFILTFNCKPQRWLTSGEDAVAIADGGTIVNPTLFESEPLLAVKGYGTIGFNGFSITIKNEVLGDVTIADGVSASGAGGSASKEFTIPQGVYNNGDSIAVNIGNYFLLNAAITSLGGTFSNITKSATDTQSGFTTDYSISTTMNKILVNDLMTSVDTITLTAGTSQTITNTSTSTISFTIGGTSENAKYTMTQNVIYDAPNRTITISFTSSRTASDSTKFKVTSSGAKINNINIILDSTLAGYGNPSYIDCDIGECYKIENDEIITLNDIITLGSDLPKLSSGTNTFTLDNTITQLEVTPRWWKV